MQCDIPLQTYKHFLQFLIKLVILAKNLYLIKRKQWFCVNVFKI